MQTMKFEEDYTYWYDGEGTLPSVAILKGKYRGLVLNIKEFQQSFDGISSNKLSIQFSIIHPWNNISEKQFTGHSVILSPKDQDFINNLIQNLVEETTSKV